LIPIAAIFNVKLVIKSFSPLQCEQLSFKEMYW